MSSTSDAGGVNNVATTSSSGGQTSTGTTVTGGGGTTEPAPTDSGIPVTTHFYDARRSGANLAEKRLDPVSVVEGSLAKVGTRLVRGGVLTQPLYLPGLELPTLGRRNVLFVTTTLNYVVAFDADDADAAPLWVRQLGTPERQLYSAFEPGTFSELGIMSTPVISSDEQALYVVAHVNSDGTPEHRLHKLSLQTGDDLVSPRIIEEPGFDAREYAQLSALLLADGHLYITFGHTLLNEGGHGRVFAYNATTLERVSALSSFEEQQIGPIWMTGQGPSWDGEFVYVAADAPDTFSSPEMFGSRLLKARFDSAGLSVEDWFLPSYVRSQGWSELGSSGAFAIPGEERVLVAGSRAVYLLDRAHLGGYVPDDAQIVQKFVVREVGSVCSEGSACNRIYASPVYWDREELPLVYLWAHNDAPRAFAYDRQTGTFDCGSAPPPQCDSFAVGEDIGIWGRQSLSLSGNQKAPGSAIVWSLQQGPQGTAILSALDAESLSTLWRSDAADLGPQPQYAFAPPVVTGGRIFVPTMAGLTSPVQASTTLARGGPSLATHNETGSLVVAWVEGASQGLAVAWSTNGQSFEGRPLLNASRSDPSLASGGDNSLYLAYVSAEENIRVEVSQSPQFTKNTVLLDLAEPGSTMPTSYTTNSAPALAFGAGNLYLAWRDESGSQVVVLASPADEPFDPESRTVLQVPVTSSPPALFASESRVFLVVPDTEGRLQMHESNDAGATFSLAGTLPATVGSGAQPALVEHRPPSFGSAAWHLFWFDDALSPELYVLSGDAAPGSLLHPVRLAGENQQARVEIPGPVAATNFLGQAYVAWNLDGYIRVARYTPGELATYGLTAATF